MKCYFLNARTFSSKSGKSYYVVTIANREGEVSEFFVSQEFYDLVAGTFKPFDFVEADLSVSRGRVSLDDMRLVNIDE